MAKTKKTASKAAKKVTAKSKSAVKAKKAAPAKAKKAPAKKVAKKLAPVKTAPKKAIVAKKVAAKKAISKKIDKPAPRVENEVTKVAKIEKIATVVEKAAPVEKVAAPKKEKAEKADKPAAVKPVPPAVPKPAPPQLTIFPVPNQRPIAHKPSKPSSSDERTRYSEEELTEFAALINKKLDKARDEYRILKETLNRNNDEGTDATSGGNTKVLEDGAETAEKENLSQLAARQQKYIMNLENALVRIKNGTYGICSVTGKLIPKERLIAVPHTTQSIEAKMMQQD
jgi:RNA polymerase-binding transcription factor DksA